MVRYSAAAPISAVAATIEHYQGLPRVRSVTGSFLCIAALASMCALTGAVMKRNRVISSSCRLGPCERLPRQADTEKIELFCKKAFQAFAMRRSEHGWQQPDTGTASPASFRMR